MASIPPTPADNPHRRACPACSGQLALTWQRPIDRLATKLVAIRRYRCQSAACDWEGNLRFEKAVVCHTPPQLAAFPLTEAHAAAQRHGATAFLLGLLLLKLSGTVPTRAARHTVGLGRQAGTADR